MDSAPVLHPDDSTLHSYSLGMLAEALAAAVDQHLEQCPDCRRRVAEIAGDGALGRLGQAAARLDETIPAESDSAYGRDSRSAPPPPSGAVPPELVEHPQYRVVRELGRGGMGVVYLAHNRLMDRLEVLKVLSKTIADRGDVVERFLREIRAAARLGHPNVVAAYSALRIGDLLVFSMEYVEGEDLAVVVRTRGPLPVAQRWTDQPNESDRHQPGFICQWD